MAIDFYESTLIKKQKNMPYSYSKGSDKKHKV